MNILQVLEMVSIDGVQFEEVMEAVERIERSGARRPISAESISPIPLHFDLIEAGLVPVDMEIRAVVLRRGGRDVFRSPTTPQELEWELATSEAPRTRAQWRRANWGMEEDFLDAEEWSGHRQGAIRYNTRDSVPYPLYEQLSTRFIDPQFQVRWLNQEGDAGLVVYQAGYRLADRKYSFESVEYQEIRDYVTDLKPGSSEHIHFPPEFANLS